MTRRGNHTTTAVFAASIAVFGAIAVAVFTWESAGRRDLQFVNWVHTGAPDWLVDTMRVLTQLGSVVLLGPLSLAATLLLMHNRRRLAAVLVLLAFVGSLFVDELLKAVFHRARPEFEDPFVQLATYAFPSGHAFGAAATYGALAIALASIATTRAARVSAFCAATGLVLVVAASRVVLGVHYVSDVLAGVAAGVAMVSGIVLILERSGRAVLPAARRDEQAQRARIDA